jgi:ABC-type Mn2+/Zn2+ transport system ATPase subunit
MHFAEIDTIEANFGTSEILKSIYLKSQKAKLAEVLGKNGGEKRPLLKIILGALKSRKTYYN